MRACIDDSMASWEDESEWQSRAREVGFCMTSFRLSGLTQTSCSAQRPIVGLISAFDQGFISVGFCASTRLLLLKDR